MPAQRPSRDVRCGHGRGRGTTSNTAAVDGVSWEESALGRQASHMGTRASYTARGAWTAASARYDWRVVAGSLDTLRDLPFPFRGHPDLALHGLTEEKHLIIEQQKPYREV